MSGKKKGQNALTDIQHILYIHILYIHIQAVRTRKVPTCCCLKAFPDNFFPKGQNRYFKEICWK